MRASRPDAPWWPRPDRDPPRAGWRADCPDLPAATAPAATACAARVRRCAHGPARAPEDADLAALQIRGDARLHARFREIRESLGESVMLVLSLGEPLQHGVERLSPLVHQPMHEHP